MKLTGAFCNQHFDTQIDGRSSCSLERGLRAGADELIVRKGVTIFGQKPRAQPQLAFSGISRCQKLCELRSDPAPSGISW